MMRPTATVDDAFFWKLSCIWSDITVLEPALVMLFAPSTRICQSVAVFNTAFDEVFGKCGKWISVAFPTAIMQVTPTKRTTQSVAAFDTAHSSDFPSCLEWIAMQSPPAVMHLAPSSTALRFATALDAACAHNRRYVEEL